MSRYYDSVHLASDQKDLLISQLKAEIFEITQRDKDYMALRDQLYTVQTKFRHLQDEKLLQDNDFKTRHDSNMICHAGLKKDSDDARYHLNDKNRVSNDCKGDIAGLREQITRREAEAFAVTRDCQAKNDHGYQLRKDTEAAAYELNKLKEERARDQLEIDRLRDLTCYKERENGEADQRIKSGDFDLFKLQERGAELAKVADTRECDFRRTTDNFSGSSCELSRAREELAKLHEEQANLQRALDCKMADKADLGRRSDAELCKNRNLTATFCGLECKIRTTEENLCVSRREAEDLRFGNAGLQGRNCDLRAEIDALQHHCAVLQN